MMISRFLRNQSGAVTVDWVVLVSLLVLLVAVIFTPFSTALAEFAGETIAKMTP